MFDFFDWIPEAIDFVGDLFDDAPNFTPLLGPAISSAAGFAGQQSTNEANVGLAQQNNAFNAEQAAINRNFQAAQIQGQQGFNAGESALNRQFQANQVSQQEGFQERMSNTAYQRAMQDMSAAGLNPMLAASRGGASSPSGSAASGSAASSGAASGSAASGSLARVENAAAVGMNSGWRAAEVAASLERTNAETDLIRAQIPKVQQETQTSKASAAQIDAHADVLRDQLKNMLEERRVLHERIYETYWSATEKEQMVKKIRPLDEQILRAEAELRELEIPGAKNRSTAEGSLYSRTLRPYLKDVFGSGGAAAGGVAAGRLMK